jgi:hypothetical protein
MVNQLNLVAQALTGGVGGAVDNLGGKITKTFGTDVPHALATTKGGVHGISDELNNVPTDITVNVTTRRDEIVVQHHENGDGNGGDNSGDNGAGINNEGSGMDNGGGEADRHEAAGGFGHASGPMTFSTQGNEDFAFSGEGRTFADTSTQADRPLYANIHIGDRLFIQQMLKLQSEELRRSGIV